MRHCIAYVALALAACGADDPSQDEAIGGSLTVTGTVHEFPSGTALTGTASISTTALIPAPTITVTGADFTIDGVPENSAFQILASVPPTHRATYSQAIEVISDDLDGVKVQAVSEDFLAALASGFSVTPSAGKGVLLVQPQGGGGRLDVEAEGPDRAAVEPEISAHADRTAADRAVSQP